MPDLPGSPLVNSLLGVALCALLAAWSFRRHFSFARGYRHRRVNWMVVSLGFLALGFMLLIHAVNLAGFETGNR